MDPHETILEELKRAQQRSLEAFTNRLDFVMESLESLIQEAKESVQEALPTESEELFPTAAVNAAVAAAQQQVTAIEERAGKLMERIEELEGRLSAAESAAAAPAVGVGIGLEALRRLDRARSQSELLRELLPVLAEHGGRAVVLVLRDAKVSAWSGIGFADGESLRRWQGAVESSPALGRLIGDGLPVHFIPGRDPVFAGWLEGEPETPEAILVPVNLRGRVVGGIYLDRDHERPWRPDVAQTAVAVACWLIDTLSLRPEVPTPMLAEPLDLRAEAEEEVVTEATPAVGYPAVEEETILTEEPPAEELQIEEEAEPAAEELETAVEPEAEPEVAEEPEPAGVAELELEGEPEAAEELEIAAAEPEEEIGEEAEEEGPVGSHEEQPGFDPSVTMRVQAPEAEVSEPEVEEAPEAEVSEPEPEVEAPPVEPVVPPPVQPVTPPPPKPAPEPPAELAGLSPQEQAQHEEARRFARLLVSEIKLYNEDEVDQGRRNNDLYQRLKEDIDRSREMFDKRVAASIREARDYFQEELVRILADGDAGALGM